MSHDPKGWAMAFFSPHTKCDALQNNISESFNAYLLEGRDMPILSMIEWIQRKLMKRIHVRYTGMSKYKGLLCPNIQDKLEKIKIDARNCFCTCAGEKKYEVDFYSTQNVVDLNNKSCSCRMWDLSGIPYKHAISAIYANKEKPESYVHAYYSTETYLAIYKHVIMPILS